MWINDASGKVEGCVLQRQQPHQNLSASSVHLPWFYVAPKEGFQQTRDIYRLPAGCERRCPEADAADSAWVAATSTDFVDACRSGATMQSDYTRMVAILWGVLSNGDAQVVSVHRHEIETMGQTEIQNTVAAQAAQCGMACQDEGSLTPDIRPLVCCRRTGWITGTVRKSRDLRTVLRESQGEIPWVYLPSLL